MSYIQGFVIAVPTANREAFRAYAAAAAQVFKELGALSVVECWGEDVPDGLVTSFRMAEPEQAERVMTAFLQMRKLDIETLERAAVRD